MGETRVDLVHLLEDLRDAYPGSLEETILTEIVANSLDSGADRIWFVADTAHATLTVVDNGAGMRRRELARYHDLAASGKVRGEGIGFAGVGIKLGLLASEEVLTETHRGKSHVATRWHLAPRHRAPWKWIPTPGLLEEQGTAVRLKLSNPLSPLLDAGFLEATLRDHFQPMFESDFEELLAQHYPDGVGFAVNGRRLEKSDRSAPEKERLELRLARKRKPSALGYILRDATPLPEPKRGVAVSTYGKIIKRGWDWLGLSPANADRIGGLIEAPGLSHCLTLNKSDFIRVGQKGALYLAFRKAIQEAAAAQLAKWGDGAPAERRKLRRARPLERDLEAVLFDLAKDFPLLASLVEKRPGGQRKLPTASVSPEEGGAIVPFALSPSTQEPPRIEETPSAGEPPAESAPEEPRESAPSSRGVARSGDLPGPGARGPNRPGRYGLSIEFEKRPGERELARLVESAVWINEDHPAYLRAAASRCEGYHIALCAAMALAKVAVEPHQAQAFVTAFLTRWGESLGVRIRSKKRRRSSHA